jgi:hypothetical protein
MKKIIMSMVVLCVLLCLAVAPAYASTVTVSDIVTDTNSYQSLAGITVASHYSIFYFTYDNATHKLTGAKGGSNCYWTSLGTMATNNGVTAAPWDTTNAVGYGKLNGRVTFTWGIPTPWGTVGSNWSDDCFCQCYGSGVYGQS